MPAHDHSIAKVGLKLSKRCVRVAAPGVVGWITYRLCPRAAPTEGCHDPKPNPTDVLRHGWHAQIEMRRQVPSFWPDTVWCPLDVRLTSRLNVAHGPSLLRQRVHEQHVTMCGIHNKKPTEIFGDFAFFYVVHFSFFSSFFHFSSFLHFSIF